MPRVRTVSGDVDASEIGLTSMHEHIFIDAQVWLQDAHSVPTVAPLDPDRPVDVTVLGALNRDPRLLRDNLRLDDEDLAVEELAHFRNAGGDCIVEVTSIGIGPNPLGLRRVAERTGLHIVAGCSFYVEPSHPAYVATATVEQLAEQITGDVTRGVGDTDVKAGIIGEIGTTAITEQQTKVLRASARAQLATGAAISIHVDPFEGQPERVVAILTEEGVTPDRIILGHMDENLVEPIATPNLANLDLHRRMLDAGVWVQYDTFGSEWYYDGVGTREPRDTERVAGLAALVADGYVRQLLVGQDVWVKQCLKRYGGWGYDHMIRVTRTMLRQAGVSDEAIEQMFVHNPRRALAFSTS